MANPYTCLLQISLLIVASATGVRFAPTSAEQRIASANIIQLPIQQADEKVIEISGHPNEPVEIENLSIKGCRIVLNQKFTTASLAEQSAGNEGDWLRGLEFTVRNKSDKQISYLHISLRFPSPYNQDNNTGTFYHFVLGIDPRTSGSAATFAKPFSLAPGDVYTVTLSDEGLQEIKKRLTMVKQTLAGVLRVFLQLGIIGFEDGTK